VLFCYYPCPCGYYGDPFREWTCSMSMVSRYQADPRAVQRISGPLLDRIKSTSKSPASNTGSFQTTARADNALRAIWGQRQGLEHQKWWWFSNLGLAVAEHSPLWEDR
jgi:hypothetical protein